MEALIAWFGEIHWVAVLQIILIDILLGGDNAVVIALLAEVSIRTCA